MHTSLTDVKNNSTRNRTRVRKEKKESYEFVFSGNKDFRSRTSTRVKASTQEKERLCEVYLSLYIVHCNYNLYLLVIDNFIDRLLILVASVISQAQISETEEARNTFFPLAVLSRSIFVINAQLLFLDCLLYARYRCEQAYRIRCS